MKQINPLQKKRGMTWVQRLIRIFNIDIEACDLCGNKVKVIACIENSAVIKHIKEQIPSAI